MLGDASKRKPRSATPLAWRLGYLSVTALAFWAFSSSRSAAHANLALSRQIAENQQAELKKLGEQVASLSSALSQVRADTAGTRAAVEIAAATAARTHANVSAIAESARLAGESSVSRDGGGAERLEAAAAAASAAARSIETSAAKLVEKVDAAQARQAKGMADLFRSMETLQAQQRHEMTEHHDEVARALAALRPAAHAAQDLAELPPAATGAHGAGGAGGDGGTNASTAGAGKADSAVPLPGEAAIHGAAAGADSAPTRALESSAVAATGVQS
jgi:hypothetical protein